VASLAVYTTVYPGVGRYVGEWYRSVACQTDRDFDLWIGVNDMPIGLARDLVCEEPGIHTTWVASHAGDTPAATRETALSQIVKAYDAVVLVDSDDVLHESRVAAARVFARMSDLAGCAMRVVDAAGLDRGMTFGLEPGAIPDEVLPRNNVFGMSNTVYRSSLLRRCLPIPADALLVDWFLATRAWLLGARLAFDCSARMSYRQHGWNTARIVPPFDATQIEQDTRRVLAHFHLMSRVPAEGCMPERVALVRQVTTEVRRFCHRIVGDARALDRYVEQLNALEMMPRWWSCVAHPSLSNLWA
jgi:hypothetical protein